MFSAHKGDYNICFKQHLITEGINIKFWETAAKYGFKDLYLEGIIQKDVFHIYADPDNKNYELLCFGGKRVLSS